MRTKVIVLYFSFRPFEVCTIYLKYRSFIAFFLNSALSVFNFSRSSFKCFSFVWAGACRLCYCYCNVYNVYVVL